MKYIKYYTESKDKFYSFISRYDMFSILIKRNLNREDFTEAEIDKIGEIFHTLHVHNPTAVLCAITLKRYKYITKYSDEWYSVGSSSVDKVAWCDGFKGLLNCLEDIKNGQILENKTHSNFEIINYPNEYHSKIRNLHAEKFTNREVEIIKELSLQKFNRSARNSLNGFIVDIETSEYGYTILRIIKFSDEWFFVNNCITDEVIMCDQFEGVIEYLNKIPDNIERYGFERVRLNLRHYNESKDNKLYKLVNIDEFDNSIVNKNIKNEDFTKYEMECICKIFPIITNLSECIILTSRGSYPIFIEKYSDEWYHVYGRYNDDIMYLCDGLKGLLDCLKDNYAKDKIIKENNDKLYKPINNPNVYKSKIKNLHAESFTKHEIDTIKKIVGNLTTIVTSSRTKRYNIIDVKEDHTLIRIIKYSDEWYFINNCINDKIILCDQFEGVIEYISTMSFEYRPMDLFGLQLTNYSWRRLP